jgi:hypothetical protein
MRQIRRHSGWHMICQGSAHMKTIKPMSWFITGLTAVAIFATPSPINATGSQPTLLAETEERRESIRGIVKEVTEKELSVTDPTNEKQVTKLALTKTTKYLKDGKEAKASDVNIGAHVAVKATKTAEGGFEAVEVNVISSKPLERHH